LALIDRVASSLDIEALTELHQHRHVFRRAGRQPLRLVEFVASLAESARTKWPVSALDRATDLTVDKFSALPLADATTAGGAVAEPGLGSARRGIDCRRYWAPVADFARARIAERGSVSALEEESVTSRALQGQVVRQFRLSLLEGVRGGSLSRYQWRVDGRGVIRVLLPRSLPGRARRGWLESAVPDANPQNPGEEFRIQQIIDHHFADAGQVPLDAVPEEAVMDDRAWFEGGHGDAMPDRPSLAVGRLAEVVADEKAATIHRQRPAIRSLGRDRLRQLVLRIFDRLADEEYVESEIAAEMGLSKPTFSRFGGHRWRSATAGRGAAVIPDLWRNTAGILSGNAEFVDACVRAGVWQRVREIARASGSRMNGGQPHA